MMDRRGFLGATLVAPLAAALHAQEPARPDGVASKCVYGTPEGEPLEDVMRRIIADAGGGSLEVAEPSGFLILPYEQQPMPVLDALGQLADLSGMRINHIGGRRFVLCAPRPDPNWWYRQ